MTESNTPELVADTLGLLAEAGVNCMLFGGWAEEARGFRQPGPHSDIDLLYSCDSFRTLDEVLVGSERFVEISGKRFAHKRAFMWQGVMVEITLVESDGAGTFTLFWGDIRFVWSAPLSEPGRLHGYPMMIVTAANLDRFRDSHRLLQPHRWRDPASLVAR